MEFEETYFVFVMNRFRPEIILWTRQQECMAVLIEVAHRYSHCLCIGVRGPARTKICHLSFWDVKISRFEGTLPPQLPKTRAIYLSDFFLLGYSYWTRPR